MISEDEIRYYKQLDERQQRVFLGLRAKSLGRSGVRAVSEAFGVNAKAVRKGKQELSDLPQNPSQRVRRTEKPKEVIKEVGLPDSEERKNAC